MKRVKLPFAGREVEFVDREAALKQFEELAEKGTRFPIVVYGPEGCGKSALLKQAIEVLREHGYSVAYVSPLVDKERDRLLYTEDLVDVVREVLGEVVSRFPDPFNSARALTTIAVEALYRAVEKGRNKKIAILADDVFQAIGLDKAELLVKQFLNMIEYPSIKYEKIVIVVASSEGVTRRRVGRHSWAQIRAMWNMSREGFRQLYDLLPEPKPPFEEVWKWTGGNPRYFEVLYRAGWDAGRAAGNLAVDRGLRAFVGGLSEVEREVLEKAVEDPDVLMEEIRKAQPLLGKLIELNLIAELPEYRDQWFWVDQPPPERDQDVGVGKYYAWQTPLHREAVRRALGAAAGGV